MKTQILLCLTTLSFACLSFAEIVPATRTDHLKPFTNVRVSMQRMLRSDDGRYFLDLYAGIWNPHGKLHDLNVQKTIAFKGLQKGDQLNLKSVSGNGEATTSEQYQLNGNLNANTGQMSSVLITAKNNESIPIQFGPAFTAVEKPLFIFKFYGLENAQQPYGRALKQVDVWNKATNTVVQSLSGFTAYPKSIGYMDINLDGYYDIVLSDTSNERKIEDKRFIYWMYNPKTHQFQRSPQLENIAGFPAIQGEKQQIDFGYGQVYQVKDGLLNRVEDN
ncbi:XAC2610-related protein [Acinetobacter kookii]